MVCIFSLYLKVCFFSFYLVDLSFYVLPNGPLFLAFF